jgi:CspA family cold shock protein
MALRFFRFRHPSSNHQDRIMQTGTVKFFNEGKGFGFIKPDSGGDDVFVHANELQKSRVEYLEEGQKVQFDLGPSKKKPGKTVAINLKVLN